MAEEREGQVGSGDRYIDSLMRKASDLVKVRNGYFGTDKHGFKKRHGGLRDGDGLICRKAILKYRHGLFAQGFIVHRLFFSTSPVLSC